jgi:hypothetical protein
LGTELANVHSLRCQILASSKYGEALAECQRSLDSLNQLVKIQGSRERTDFQRLFRDLGYNYAAVAKQSLAGGATAVAQSALQDLSRVMPNMSAADRAALNQAYPDLNQAVPAAPAKPR